MVLLHLWQPREVKVAQLCPTFCDPMDCSLPGSSVHRILPARILEWIASPFSMESSRLRDQTQVSCIVGRFFTVWAIREALSVHTHTHTHTNTHTLCVYNTHTHTHTHCCELNQKSEEEDGNHYSSCDTWFKLERSCDSSSSLGQAQLQRQLGFRWCSQTQGMNCWVPGK